MTALCRRNVAGWAQVLLGSMDALHVVCLLSQEMNRSINLYPFMLYPG